MKVINEKRIGRKEYKERGREKRIAERGVRGGEKRGMERGERSKGVRRKEERTGENGVKKKENDRNRRRKKGLEEK